MALEANFCGDRLRMATFLRVMEQGIPPRPRRFRRRVQAIEESTYEPNLTVTSRESSLVHVSVEVLAHGVPQPPTPETLSSRIEFNYVHQSSPSNVSAIDTNSTYKVLCSLEPTELCVGPVDDNELKRAHSHRQHLSPLLIKQAQHDSHPQTHKTAGKPHSSMSTRKRRLPVNGLALLRTTTSDGLPVPGPVEDVLTTPISESDPIEDSQMFFRGTVVPTKSRRIEANLNKIITFKSHVSSKKPRASNTPATKLMKTLVRRHKKPWKRHDHKLHVQSAFAVASDGFVGGELATTTTKKRTKRPGKNLMQARQIVSAIGGLALENGRLPSPGLDLAGPSSAPSDHGRINRLHTTFKAWDSLSTATSEQPTLERKSDVASDRSVADNRSQTQEIEILTKLSSITAPPRRDSERSRSEIMEKDGLFNDEQHPDTGVSLEVENHNADSSSNDDEGDETDSSSRSQPVSIRRKPTYVDDNTHFQNALNDLDMIMMGVMARVQSEFPDLII